MISPCLYCGFIHTVVEAQYENGRMVVDPIWNIDYPTGDARFLGVRGLAGTKRVVELQHQRPATDKIARMPEKFVEEFVRGHEKFLPISLLSFQQHRGVYCGMVLGMGERAARNPIRGFSRMLILTKPQFCDTRIRFRVSDIP